MTFLLPDPKMPKPVYRQCFVCGRFGVRSMHGGYECTREKCSGVKWQPFPPAFTRYLEPERSFVTLSGAVVNEPYMDHTKGLIPLV